MRECHLEWARSICFFVLRDFNLPVNEDDLFCFLSVVVAVILDLFVDDDVVEYEDMDDEGLGACISSTGSSLVVSESED